eukprot:TRINITY_DN11589_c0_g2_i1.p1 TRINITY_DN11589_c0_g2~~TRINITY_DN11589_c0_g2_i1.p1  ORF type:complete len:246 (-),score=62.76 TRINITY_DN11589_c0_g2_i1:311-1048(-)
MLVKVKSLTGQVTDVDGLANDAQVGDLKSRIEQMLGVPPSVQRLIFSGRELAQDDLLLSECRVVDGSFVHLVIRKNPPSSAADARAAVPPQSQDNNDGDGRPAVYVNVTPVGLALNDDGFRENLRSLRFLVRILGFFVMFAVLQIAIYAVVWIVFFPLLIIPMVAWKGLRTLKYELVIPFTLLQVVMVGVWGLVLIVRKRQGASFSMPIFMYLCFAVATLRLCVTFITTVRRMSLEQRLAVMPYL